MMEELQVLVVQAFLTGLRADIVAKYPTRVRIEQEGAITKSSSLYFSIDYGSEAHSEQGSTQVVNCKLVFDRDAAKLQLTCTKVPTGAETRTFQLDQLGEIQTAEHLIERAVLRDCIQPSYLDHFEQMLEFHLMMRDFSEHSLQLEVHKSDTSLAIDMPELKLQILMEVASVWGQLKLSFVCTSSQGHKTFGHEIAGILEGMLNSPLLG